VHAICGRGSVPMWRQCDKLCTSGFVDDVMFSYNAGNRPQSKTTNMFRPVRQVAAPVGHQTTLFGRDGQVAATGRSLPSSTASSFLCCRVSRGVWGRWRSEPRVYWIPLNHLNLLCASADGRTDIKRRDVRPVGRTGLITSGCPLSPSFVLAD